MISANLQDVQPFLRNLEPEEATRVNEWITVLSAVLNARYGEKITPENTPVFVFFMSQAINRLLDNPNTTVISQSTESSSVTYTAHSTKGDLFLAAELSQMDTLTGKKSSFLIRATSPKILDR